MDSFTDPFFFFFFFVGFFFFTKSIIADVAATPKLTPNTLHETEQNLLNAFSRFRDDVNAVIVRAMPQKEKGNYFYLQ